MDRGRTNHRGRTLPGTPNESERRPGMRAIGTSVSRVAAPIVARHGGSVLARLKAEWALIAGADLAALAWPAALGRDGALKLRVVPVAALALQHRIPRVVERINGFFGRPVIARIVLVQGPLPLPAQLPPAPPIRASERQMEALDAQLASVADPELRAALSGLGMLVLGGSRRR